MIELILDQQSGNLFEPLDPDIGTIIQHADLLGAQFFHQVTPFRQYALGAAAAPLDRHDALAAEGAAVRATPAGQDTKAACTVHMIGGGLQIGVAVHLKMVIGRPGQAVQVGNRRAVRVVVNLAVTRLIANTLAILKDFILRMHKGFGMIDRLILQIGF